MSESKIKWKRRVSDTYYGVVPGEEDGYYIYRHNCPHDGKTYLLYKNRERIAAFRHLANAKVLAEYAEKNDSTLLDLITRSPLWKINAGD
jgi:hypothetical protein